MAKELVYENNSESDLNVSYIAEQLQVSSAYLSTLYKMETGKNLVKFITWYRVEKSKELLCQTNMKVSDVAERSCPATYRWSTSSGRQSDGHAPIPPKGGWGRDHGKRHKFWCPSHRPAPKLCAIIYLSKS